MAPMIITVAGLLLLLVALIVAAVILQEHPKPTPAMVWARSNGIDLTETTGPPVEVYLRNSVALRRVGAFGGLVLPPAITAGLGIDLHLAGFIWVLVGYLAGVIVAEVSLARVPADGRRSASLEVRRLRDYLPRPLLATQLVLPIVAVALSLVVRARGAAVVGPSDMGWTEAGAMAAGPLAVLILVASSLGERYLVRRPQPMVAPDLVALDDAMRSSSIRRIAATTVAIDAFLLTTQFSAIAYGLEPASSWQSVLWVSAGVVMLLAYLSWQWWVNRGWRVRRPVSPTIGGLA